MFWKRDPLVEQLIEKNLARPIPGMEKPDLARAAKFVGRKQTDYPSDEQQRAAEDVDLELGTRQ